MKKLLILGAGVEQLPGIKKAKELGLHVIVFDYNPHAIGFPFADESYVISTIDVDAAVAKAKELRPDGVITLASDLPMRTVAAIGATLSIPAISVETALRATDKGEMRKALKEHGVPVPEFFIVKNWEEFLQAASWFNDRGLPFITKPCDNAASRGVSLCQGKTDLDAVYSFGVENSHGGNLMVEEYMSGPEVSVETIAVNGTVNIIAITDKMTTGAPHFVEIGHSQPSRLSPEIREQIRQVAIAANRAIGISDGPSHTEIIVTKHGPKIVELGARLGGDNINTHLVPLSTGISIVEGVIRCALGEAPDLTPKFTKGSAIRFFSAGNGTLRAIHGLEAARRVPGVVQVDAYANVGDSLSTLKSSDDRLGCVVAQADSPEAAIAVCEQAVSCVKFEIG